ncbi:MAG: mechanosensitive ion channel family protein [Oligoflexales bacterium]
MDTEILLATISQFTVNSKHYLYLALQVVLILTIGYLLSRWLSSRFNRTFSKFRHVDQTTVVFLTGVIHYSILILTFIICLGKLGVQTASIVTVLGAAGLAVGLALQGTLTNIASGIMILFLRPFKIGEYIEVGETRGTVQVIGLFSTQLKDANGLFVMAPNSQLWSKTIKNYSRNDVRRIVIPIRIAYCNDISKTKAIIMDRLIKNSKVLSTPAPIVLVDLLDSSSVNLLVKFWIARSNYETAKSTMAQLLKEHLHQHEISIPFPQRDVNLIKR